ncbi:hypothetical protein ACFQAT_06670 [Undibacterium arcticum]|uniref:Uncharacterized protein n=1 Tax=Undibacterium arcticum TaxID=1762892 RepID=A0ABV7EZA3_9BURK
MKFISEPMQLSRIEQELVVGDPTFVRAARVQITSSRSPASTTAHDRISVILDMLRPSSSHVMIRRRKDLQELDTDAWPTVDTNALSVARRATFQAYYHAIQHYVSGEVVREIAHQTGINGRQIYTLLDRCLTQAEDGRIFGSMPES